MRYYRFGGSESANAAVLCFLGWRNVIAASGCPVKDVNALVNCLMHGCTCDGCDLVNGDRIVRAAWLGGTGASSAP